MIDMSQVIIAKSDQINAADLLGTSRNVTIAGVKLTGKEQATEIRIEGDDKVWRPCKNMVRVMSRAWGIDGEKWIGQSATLYCDPKVTFGKDKPGGIRISHLSGLRGTLNICLQERKGSLRTYEIEPLAAERPAPTRAAEQHNPETGELPPTDKAQQWADTTLAAIAATDSRAALAELQQRSAKAMQKLSAERPELSHRVSMAFVERVNAFDEPATLEPADDDAPF